MIGLLGRWISQNPYKVLGLSRNATPKEIREAYLNLARKYHPDVAPSQIELFKSVNEAYHTLKNLPHTSRPFPNEQTVSKEPEYEVKDMLWTRSSKEFIQEPSPVEPSVKADQNLPEVILMIVLPGFLTFILIRTIRTEKRKKLEKLSKTNPSIESNNPI